MAGRRCGPIPFAWPKLSLLDEHGRALLREFSGAPGDIGDGLAVGGEGLNAVGVGLAVHSNGVRVPGRRGVGFTARVSPGGTSGPVMGVSVPSNFPSMVSL